MAVFKCQDCGRGFNKPPSNGECPGCGSSDLDLASDAARQAWQVMALQYLTPFSRSETPRA